MPSAPVCTARAHWSSCVAQEIPQAIPKRVMEYQNRFTFVKKDEKHEFPLCFEKDTLGTRVLFVQNTAKTAGSIYNSIGQ